MVEGTIIWVDMDDTLCAFSKGIAKYEHHPFLKSIHYKQSIDGFFSGLDFMEGGKEAWFELEAMGYDMRICTRASQYNLGSMTEKGVWVRDNLGFEYLEILNQCPDKSQIGNERDYLIDDMVIHGQPDFKGTFMQFGQMGEFKNWAAILEYFKGLEND